MLGLPFKEASGIMIELAVRIHHGIFCEELPFFNCVLEYVGIILGIYLYEFLLFLF